MKLCGARLSANVFLRGGSGSHCEDVNGSFPVIQEIHDGKSVNSTLVHQSGSKSIAC